MAVKFQSNFFVGNLEQTEIVLVDLKFTKLTDYNNENKMKFCAVRRKQ